MEYLNEIEKPTWVRHVVVPTITDDNELLEKTAQYISKFPIPIIEDKRKDELIEYVQKCFKNRSDYDTFINEIVYQIYGFNNVEINHIEHLM